jgi:PIN domain nuclease of toxin-antitoxin system
VRYLIDTHTFLWFSDGSQKLSPGARLIIANKNNAIFLSIASLWEISIKTSLGKLEVSGSYELVIEDITKNEIELLPINFAHTVKQNQLPFHHRDPFDRMIISQALVENMDLISRDDLFDAYVLNESINRIW